MRPLYIHRSLIWSLAAHGLGAVVLTVWGATSVPRSKGASNGISEFVEVTTDESRSLRTSSGPGADKRQPSRHLVRKKRLQEDQALSQTPRETSAASGALTEMASKGDTTQSGTSGRGGNSVRSSYLGSVLATIERNKFYPREARKRRLAGEVTVAFRIHKDGTATDIRVDCECAHAVLNKAAVAVVASIGKFDPIPAELGLEKIDLKVPIEFELL